MRKKIITSLMSVALTVSVITGCGNTATDNEQVPDTTASTENQTTTESTAESTADSTAENSAAKKTPTNFSELIASLHAGQSYAYAPICEGSDALLVTSYSFDDLEGHMATYEATIYIEKDGSVEKITTVQSGGTAYPIAVTDDNSLILCMRNSVVKGHIHEGTDKFVITEEAHVNYTEAEDGDFHNYKEGVADIPSDSSLYDELTEAYQKSDILSFTKAGAAADGSPILSGAVYAAYTGDNLYDITSFYVFDSENSGHTESPDGLTGLPFAYELKGEDILFHFGSADDNSEAKFGWENASFPTLTFTGDNETITLSCLGCEDPETFEAAKYYDNDNNLYMQVKKFDETSLTGDLYRNEKIKAEYVENATEGSNIYSVNGTQYQVVSFEDANKELGYGTDEEFKRDSVGTSRFDKFIVKCTEEDAYYALEKDDYSQGYKVVMLFNEGNDRKLIEENVTFKIKENCEIILQKFVNDGQFDNLTSEYLIGREFKGDNYPGWAADAKEYYMTNEMLVGIGVIDKELYSIVQIYVP